MKKHLVGLMALAMILSFSGSLWASNSADVDQSGYSNTAYIEQVGGSSKDNSIDIDQIAASTEANSAIAHQKGNGNDIDVYQKALTGSNTFYIEQLDYDTAGNVISVNNVFSLSQIAGSSGADNDNIATAYQWGSNNVAKISQTAATDNTLYLKQDGDSNMLVGANSDGTINSEAAATQISATSYNDLSCVQGGNGNKVGLYQNANGYNKATITQSLGSNSLVAWQNAPYGSNELTVTQNGGMSAVVIQNAISGNNVATITQQ